MQNSQDFGLCKRIGNHATCLFPLHMQYSLGGGSQPIGNALGGGVHVCGLCGLAGQRADGTAAAGLPLRQGSPCRGSDPEGELKQATWSGPPSPAGNGDGVETWRSGEGTAAGPRPQPHPGQPERGGARRRSCPEGACAAPTPVHEECVLSRMRSMRAGFLGLHCIPLQCCFFCKVRQ